MKFSGKRTTLALGLVALAVIVPGAAWYLVGTRELERQIAEQSESAKTEAQETALRLARQLADRLALILEAEAQRSFDHYQTYFHDPKRGAVTLSPLSAAPTDPLLEFYFQADGETGKITGPESELKPASQETRALLERQFDPGLTALLSNWRGECRAAIAGKSGQRVETLEESVWQQNRAALLFPKIPPPVPVLRPGPTVSIFIGPLKWRTVYLANKPALVALREVCTPDGTVFQGFLVSTKWFENFFKSNRVLGRFRPGRPENELQAGVNLGGEPWRVLIQPDGDVADEQGHGLRRVFLTIYIGGVAIAAVAGLGVVWLVWHSDRVARQRVQFAASAAHELRTPLAGLRIYSDMLADGLGDAGKTREYAQRIATEADRLGRVVANLLSFTRYDRGVLRAQPVPGDLGAAVHNCITRQELALATAGSAVTVEIAPDLPAVKFDRDALAEIVENLLDNAEKHTRRAADRTIQVRLVLAGRGVELVVADRGPGVPEEVRRHLFEAFTRGRENDAPAGLGLGLVLVKALAEAQGATVTYTDNAGGGARFVVTFPV